MDSNQKRFSTYVFLSAFARNLVELFIPIILYKFGFSLKEVIFYYLYVNMFSLLMTYPCFYISSKYSNRTLSIIGVIGFILTQLLLNYIVHSVFYLMLIAFSYALYRRGYWIARRFYNLKVIKKDNISSTYSLISIISQSAIVVSSYIGAIFLDYYSIKLLTIIAMFLFFVSVIPLYLLKFEHKETSESLEFYKTVKSIPKRDLYLFGTYELVAVLKFLFPLYLFIYVKDNYQTVGILSLLANIATIVFAYFYGKKTNKDKNFLQLSIFLVVFVLFLKSQFTSSVLILISFLEGIVMKMQEISIQKEFLSLSKKFNYQNYNLVYETTQNVFRTSTSLILFFFVKDLKIMIYIVLLLVLSGIFVKFKYIETKDYKAK